MAKEIGFDRRLRMYLLCWGIRAGSRLTGPPKPIRRPARYVIGRAFNTAKGFCMCAELTRLLEVEVPSTNLMGCGHSEA
jgi:hypothetical protein